MADLTEASVLDLLEQIKREHDRPLTLKPTRVHWPLCTTCNELCRYDGPYWMCDNCERVVGWDL